MKSLVTKRTVSVGPTGVEPLRIWSTTAVVPLQWNVIFRPETCGKRPVATRGVETGRHRRARGLRVADRAEPVGQRRHELRSGERLDDGLVAERQHGEHLAVRDLV